LGWAIFLSQKVLGISSTIFTQFARKATEVAEITQKAAITPFKVIQGHRFDANRKLIYDFL